MHRFTSEFEMGSGGTSALWPPGKLVCKSSTRLASVWLDSYLNEYRGLLLRLLELLPTPQNVWVLYGQASRAISTG